MTRPTRKKHATIALILLFSTALLVTHLVKKASTHEDSFLAEIDATSKLSNRELDKIAQKYIPIGTPTNNAINYLKERGFTVYKTENRESITPQNNHLEKYHAYKEERKNLIILATTDIILISDKTSIIEIYGKINLTGI